MTSSGPVDDLAFHQPQRGGVDDLEIIGHRFAHTFHFHQPFRFGTQHFGKGAEAGEQGLGKCLGVAPADGAEQHHFKQLIVWHRIGAAVLEAGFQPVTMAQKVWYWRLDAGIFEAGHGSTLVGRAVVALGAEGEDFAAGFGDANGVFELC